MLGKWIRGGWMDEWS